MACKYFNGSGCGGCRHFLKSTAIAVVGGNLQVTVPKESVVNREPLCICLAQPIPGTVTPNMVVTVLIGAAPFNIINRHGNFLYADQIRSRTVLHVTAAVDTNSLVLDGCNKLCPTAHVFPIINPPVVVTLDAQSKAKTKAEG